MGSPRSRLLLAFLLLPLGCGGSSGQAPSRVISGNTSTAAGKTKDYRKVWGGSQSGGAVQSYVALYDLSTDLTEGALDFLNGAKSPVVPLALESGPKAAIGSVRMAPGAPDAVAWVDAVDMNTGLGTIRFADLSASSVVPVSPPGMVGTGAPENAITFGANGHQMLFVSKYNDVAASSAPLGGQLFFWDGSSMPRQLKGMSTTGTSPTDAVIMSEDRTTAIVIVDWLGDVPNGPTHGTGSLMAVDMTTGQTTFIDSNVTLYMGSYAPLYENTFVGNGNANIVASSTAEIQRAFSTTPDCSSVVYTKYDSTSGLFQVFQWNKSSQGMGQAINANGGPAVGIFPGISRSGQFVAWWDFYQSELVQQNQIVLHVVQSGKDLYDAVFNIPGYAGAPNASPTITMPALPPIFSPDEGLVAFLTDFNESGSGAYGGELGSLWMLPVQNIPSAYLSSAAAYARQAHLGDNVAYRSVSFGPKADGTLSSLLLFLGDVQDTTGKHTLDDASGNLYAVDTSTWPPTGFGTGNQVDSRVGPGNVFYLPTSNCTAYIKGNAGDGHPFVWCPGMSLPRDLEAENPMFKMNPGTFRTFPITTDLGFSPADAVLYMDEVAPFLQWDAASGAPITESQIRVARIVKGTESVAEVDTGTGVTAEDNGFIFADYSQAGRIMGCFDQARAPTTGTSSAAGMGTAGSSGGSGMDNSMVAGKSSICMDLPLP